MTSLRTALLAASAAILAAGAAFAEDAPVSSMRINYDQSAVLRLDRAARTVIVGNAYIADAQLVNERTVYVLGRMFGNTNIIALDGDGNEVVNTYVTVGTPNEQQVTVYRGPAGQRNLACSPMCERTITQGDAEMQAIHQDDDKKTDISSKAAALSASK